MTEQTFSRRLAAEFIGTAMLLAVIVGSGIMAERLAGGNMAIALLGNTIAIGVALVALILMFAPVSGAHLNPIVSIAAALTRDMAWADAGVYVSIQIAGALFGVALANLMFDLPIFFAAEKVRTGSAQWLGEFIASFGLIGVIIAVSRRHKTFVVALAVAAYITAAIWFTSSTSFANPAVTVARSLSNTYTGIRPPDAPLFIIAQLFGGVAAAIVFNWLIPRDS